MSTHNVTFYGLSTCIHCRHAREFLEQHHIPFDMHYVDLAEGQERDELILKVKQFNPRLSFPTIVIDDDKTIVGFQPEALTEALSV